MPVHTINILDKFYETRFYNQSTKGKFAFGLCFRLAITINIYVRFYAFKTLNIPIHIETVNLTVINVKEHIDCYDGNSNTRKCRHTPGVTCPWLAYIWDLRPWQRTKFFYIYSFDIQIKWLRFLVCLILFILSIWFYTFIWRFCFSKQTT